MVKEVVRALFGKCSGGIAGILIGSKICIRYIDGCGNISIRDVLIRGLSCSGDIPKYIDVDCFLYNARRTLRVDRIQSVIDSSGEVHPIRRDYLLERFGIEIPHRPDEDPEKLVDHCKRGLRVLVMVAVADGPLTEIEREILFEYVAARADMLSFRLGEESIQRIAKMLPRMRPTLPIVLKALQDQAFFRGWDVHHRLIQEHALLLAAAAPPNETVSAVLAMIEDAATFTPIQRD